MRYAALDTKFLLALAGGEQDAEGTIDYLRSIGFFPIITESVIEQIGELQRSTDSSAYIFAEIVAKNFIYWGILDVPNPNILNGTSCVHAEKILAQNLIPDGTLFEAEMLVEASCHNCEILVTFSDALLNAPSAPLNLALIDNGLVNVTVAIASPEMISQRVKIRANQVLEVATA